MIKVHFKLMGSDEIIESAEMPDCFYSQMTHMPVVLIKGKTYTPLFGASIWDVGGGGDTKFVVPVREWTIE